jgi:hypothetical protein
MANKKPLSTGFKAGIESGVRRAAETDRLCSMADRETVSGEQLRWLAQNIERLAPVSLMLRGYVLRQ